MCKPNTTYLMVFFIFIMRIRLCQMLYICLNRSCDSFCIDTYDLIPLSHWHKVSCATMNNVAAVGWFASESVSCFRSANLTFGVFVHFFF